MPPYDSEPANHRNCLNSSRSDGFSSLDTWQGWIRHLTSLERSRCQSEGCPRIGGVPSDVLVMRGYAPWMQISSLTTLASTLHGNTRRIENIGSTSWKPLCSSSGHVHDDDDDDDDESQWLHCRCRTNSHAYISYYHLQTILYFCHA